MKHLLYQSQWNWWVSGIALGLVFLLAVLLIKPIGVSTQFVILDGIIWNGVSNDVIVEDPPGTYSSPNPYLNQYAEDIARPWHYDFVFVLAIILGGFIASRLQGGESPPSTQASRFDQASGSRYLTVFIGGMLVLFGARLAGGCTSGHMMSGIMQTSVSGFLFMFGAFVVAIPVAIYLYDKGE